MSKNQNKIIKINYDLHDIYIFSLPKEISNYRWQIIMKNNKVLEVRILPPKLSEYEENKDFYLSLSENKLKKMKFQEVIMKEDFGKYIHILTKELIHNNKNKHDDAINIIHQQYSDLHIESMERVGIKVNDEEYSSHNILREDKGEYDVLCNYANNVFCIDFEKKNIEDMLTSYEDYILERNSVKKGLFSKLLNKLFN